MWSQIGAMTATPFSISCIEPGTRSHPERPTQARATLGHSRDLSKARVVERFFNNKALQAHRHPYR